MSPGRNCDACAGAWRTPPIGTKTVASNAVWRKLMSVVTLATASSLAATSKADVWRADQRVVGTQAGPHLSMLDRRTILALPPTNDRAEAECKRRRGAERRRTV